MVESVGDEGGSWVVAVVNALGVIWVDRWVLKMRLVVVGLSGSVADGCGYGWGFVREWLVGSLGMKRLDDWTTDERQLKNRWIEVLHNELDRENGITLSPLPS
jgi:hypothetical protein